MYWPVMYWNVVAGISFGIWLYLLFGRGGYWRETIQPKAPEPQSWPDIVAIVPARNEASGVGDALGSLLVQDYPGSFSVVLVDDHSDDGTADIARRAAAAAGAEDRLTVVQAKTLPPGWTGKLWAMSQGVKAVDRGDRRPDLILFTDADIVHHRTNLRELAARIAEGNDLVSLMVRLRCESFAERLMVPAFVYFFAMLYPFAWIRDRKNRMSGAAGGCMLLRRDALKRIGGIDAIRDEIIDDCALGRAVKRGGKIWLGLTTETRSLRAYPVLGDIWRMVARTAYAQLNYSPFLLLGTVVGLALTFLAPVAAVACGGDAAPLGLAAWAMMAVSYLPVLRLYGRSPVFAPLLPVIALIYMGAMIDSARRHWQGKGGEWKGRVQQRGRA